MLSFQQLLMQVYTVKISVKIVMVISSCQLFSQSQDNFSQSYFVFLSSWPANINLEFVCVSHSAVTAWTHTFIPYFVGFAGMY